MSEGFDEIRVVPVWHYLYFYCFVIKNSCIYINSNDFLWGNKKWELYQI
jgi:hypothetical protein